MIYPVVTYATVITLMRCALTPVIVYGILYGLWGVVIALLLFAGITDYADGCIARYFSQESRLGALLDPVADKMLLLSCYGTLWYRYGEQVGIPWFFYVMAFFREWCILIGAFYVLQNNAGVAHPTVSLMPTWWGKWTMAAQILLLLVLCVRMLYASQGMAWTCTVVMILVVIGMMVSWMQYMWRGLERA